MTRTKPTLAALLALAALTPALAAAQAADAASPAGPAAPADTVVDTEAPPPVSAPPAPVAAAPVTPDDFRNAWVTLGVRAGVYVPGVVNAMDPHANLTFEVAVLLPFLDRMLGVTLDGSWAGPGSSRERMDPRLGESGAAWSYSMQTQEGFFSAGLIFRFLPPGSVFVPYLSAVARLYLLETRVNGSSGGQEFGENIEQSAQAGFGVSAGGELRLGPGALLLDVSFGYSDLPHVITGATSTGALGAQLGYRLFL
jgi:hypothetical protein